jgi:2-methylcitrate dehydratase PrpD
MLAARGLTGPHSALERMDGFAPTHSPSFSPGEALKPARSNFHVEDTIFKYHVNCFETHAVINAIAEMKRAHGLDPSSISHVDVYVDENLRGVCNIAAPTDGAEMKLSLTSAAALALLGHDTGRLDTFTEKMANDPEFIRARERVSVHLMRDYPQSYADVSLTAHDGTQFKSSSSVAEPESDLDRQEGRLKAKCHMLLDPIIGRARCSGLIDDMSRFDELSVRDLVRHFSAH